MDAKEPKKPEMVEDLTVNEDTAADVKGGETATGAAGAGKIKFNEFQIKKTTES